MKPESDPAVLTNILVSVFWSFGYCAFFCEFGDMLIDQFESLDEKVYRSHWYAYPIEMQQMTLILMSSTQRLAPFRGYGNIICTRDTFKMVGKYF